MLLWISRNRTLITVSSRPPPFLQVWGGGERGGPKKFSLLVKRGGTCTFWIFRGRVGFFRGGGGDCGFSESNFQLLIKYHIRKIKCKLIALINHNLIYLPTIFKCLQHALCKHNIRLFGEFSFRKGKVSCYWIIIFLCRVIKMKFYWFIAVFLFER